MAGNPELPDHSVGNKTPRAVLAVRNPSTGKYHELKGDSEGGIATESGASEPLIEAFAELTAPGTSASKDASDYENHTFQITIAGIDASVDIQMEGSLDGSNWFNLDDSGNATQYTANGTYLMHKSNFRMSEVRVNFVSESSSPSSATVNVTYMGG